MISPVRSRDREGSPGYKTESSEIWSLQTFRWHQFSKYHCCSL